MAELSLKDGTDIEQLGPDTRFSIIALISFLVGLINVVVLANPVLISIPAIGVLLGFFAMAFPARLGLSPLSKSLAVIGIASGLIFGAWSVTQNQLTRYRLFSTAAEYGQKYVNLLAHNDVDGALAFSVRTNTQETSSSPATFDYARATFEERKVFVATPGRKEVLERGPQGKWKYAGPRSIVTMPDGKLWIKVAFQDQSKPRSPKVAITFSRSNSLTKSLYRYAWLVAETTTE